MFTLEKNGPIVAQQMRELAAQWPGHFVAIALFHDGRKTTIVHRTGKQGFKALASMCDSRRGKLYGRGSYAAALVTPCGRVMTYHEARSAFRTV